MKIFGKKTSILLRLAYRGRGGRSGAGGPVFINSVPSNAVKDDDGNVIRDDDGNIVLDDS